MFWYWRIMGVSFGADIGGSYKTGRGKAETGKLSEGVTGDERPLPGIRTRRTGW